MFQFFEEWAKHFVLNFGQALQGIRYIYSHPDFDDVARRGSFKHLGLSLKLRSKRVLNDIFFAVIPPHWHHTRDQLQQMTTISASRWLQYGYCAWKFTNSGERKEIISSEVDKRWDPRCKKINYPEESRL